MKKTFIMILILILAFSVIGCNDKSHDQTDNSQAPQQTEENENNENSTESDINADSPTTTARNINAVATAIGVTGSGEETLYGLIEAEDGKQFNDGKIEIYQFDPESKAYKEIEKTMKIFDGEIKVTAVNDGFALIFSGYEDPEMLDKFKELKF